MSVVVFNRHCNHGSNLGAGIDHGGDDRPGREDRWGLMPEFAGWRTESVWLYPQEPAGLPGLEFPISGAAGKLLDRLKAAIAELGYEAVIEDLSSPELVWGEDSLLGSEDVMVIPGHIQAVRPSS